MWAADGRPGMSAGCAGRNGRGGTHSKRSAITSRSGHPDPPGAPGPKPRVDPMTRGPARLPFIRSLSLVGMLAIGADAETADGSAGDGRRLLGHTDQDGRYREAHRESIDKC